MNSLRPILMLLLTVATVTAKTRVRIEGMRSMSSNQALVLLGERLEHVRASPASPSRADDAAFLLRQALHKEGYADAHVRWRIAGSDSVVLTVNEGGRLSLGPVTVYGVSPDEAKKLAKLYARPAGKDRPLVAAAPPFREEDVAVGLSYVQQELHANGYWAAQASLRDRQLDAASGVVSVAIDVVRGEVHPIGTPVINSADGRGVKLTATAVAPFVGKEASTANLNAMRNAVEQTAVSRGYPDAVIRMGRRLVDGRFIPEFSIDLGTRVRLRNIDIEGLERTKPERIAKRMQDMEGEWYDEAAMNKRLRAMLATGAFSAASVETEVVGERLVDATLHFEEARAREVSIAAGFGSYQGMITRFTYTDRNLMGNLWGLNAGFEFGYRGVLGDVRVTDPWLYGSDVSATARAFALVYGREGYDSFESGLEGKVTWEFGPHYTLELLLGNSVVNLSSDGLPSSELGETVYGNPKLRVTQSLDFRDNAVLPTKGWHLENPLEVGAAVGGLSTSYLKAGLTGGWYHKLNRDYHLGFGGEWGVLIPSGDSGDLPIDLRLFNGGARSVRSFPERELGPTFDGYPTGGEGMWNTNLELMRNITDSVKAVAFVDSGTLARNFEDIGSVSIEMAAGIGIRLDLPIGPVRLEYGYNLTRDPGEPAGTIHFAIGYAY